MLWRMSADSCRGRIGTMFIRFPSRRLDCTARDESRDTHDARRCLWNYTLYVQGLPASLGGAQARCLATPVSSPPSAAVRRRAAGRRRGHIFLPRLPMSATGVARSQRGNHDRSQLLLRDLQEIPGGDRRQCHAGLRARERRCLARARRRLQPAGDAGPVRALRPSRAARVGLHDRQQQHQAQQRPAAAQSRSATTRCRIRCSSCSRPR